MFAHIPSMSIKTNRQTLLGRIRETKGFMYAFVDREFHRLIDWTSQPGVQNALQLYADMQWANSYISLDMFDEVLEFMFKSTTDDRDDLVAEFQNIIRWNHKFKAMLLLENLEDIAID